MSATSLSIQAMRSLVGDDFQHMIASTDYDTFILVGAEKPPKEEFEAKLQELLDAQPLKELRQERNRRLAEVDWVFSTDYQMEDGERSVWVAYRQALRDLPSVTEDPTNPLWPTKPSTPTGTTTSVNIQQIASENVSLRTKVTNLERKAASQELSLIELRKRVEKLGG